MMQSLFKGRARGYATAVAAAAVAAVVAATAAPTIGASADTTGTSQKHPRSAAEIVAATDVKYQAAVKTNDVRTIARILTDDFVIVTGKGSVFTKADVLNDAKTQACAYERQDEMPGTQKVRVFGQSTATVTALLWIKGNCTDGSKFDQKLWFSDTYVLRHGTWGYSFGQSSIHI
jgi:ketosteroid isomerase-like protein